MKKIGLVFFLLAVSLFAQAQEIDSVHVSESNKNFKFGVRFGANGSQLDFCESVIFGTHSIL